MKFFISKTKFKDCTIKFLDYWVYCSDGSCLYTNDKELLLLEGFIFNLVKGRKLTLTEIIQLARDVITKSEVLPPQITGQFNVLYLTNHESLILNDFCGNLPFYYKQESDVMFTNNEHMLLEMQLPLDKVAITQSMLGPSHVSYNNRSNFEGVSRLLPGEYIYTTSNNVGSFKLVDQFDTENHRLNSNEDIESLDEALKGNAKVYFDSFDKVVLPISGGVDSRITLSATAPVLKEKEVLALSYGSSKYIDNKIARRLSTYLSLEHINVNFKQNLFPTKLQLDSVLTSGGEFYITPWFNVRDELSERNLARPNVVMLIGDVYDLLRSKNVRSNRGRKTRIVNAIKGFLGFKMQHLEKFDEEKFMKDEIANLHYYVNKLKDQDSEVFEKVDISEEHFISTSIDDIKSFVEFLKLKIQARYQQNIEEAYYAFTWSRKAMGKQVSLFKGTCSSYIMMANRHIAKMLFAIHPYDRLEDNLTHKILKLHQNKGLAKFGTSQVPNVPYSRAKSLKYFFWASRFLIDRVIITLNKKGLINRERLVTHIEYFKYYKDPQNEVNLHSILPDHPLANIPKRMFERRKSGLQRSFAEPDIVAFLYPIHLLSKY